MLLCLACTACATRVTETPGKSRDSDQPFGSYARVLLVKSELAAPYSAQGSNTKAANRIDYVLARGIGPILNDVEVYTAQEVDRMDLTGTSTLLIRPRIKQIKFINVGARIATGPLSGSGVVVMDTEFVDGASDTTLGTVGQYRKAGAWSSTFGSADNRMLSAIGADIVAYTQRNRCPPRTRYRRPEPSDDNGGKRDQGPIETSIRRCETP